MINFEYKEQLKQNYPILDFLPLSAKTGEGFKILERVLKKTFQENPIFQTPDLPTAWLKVRAKIQDLQTTDLKTLTWEDFQAICQEYKVEKSAKTILGYLHDTGVLYYRVDYFQNQIILNQDWAIQAIYQILDRESEYFEVLQYEKGKLDYELLSEIWANNTDEERALFIDFMLSAELAFETTKKDKYESKPLAERTFIVPQLLPSEKPSDVQYWEQKNTNQLQKVEIPYRFLPKVFIQRFIVKAQQFSEVPLMWQKGLLLQTREGVALIEAFYEKEKQKIIISAENEFLIQKIKEELAEIANEGKLRSKEGISDSENEKFGLNALNTIIEPKPIKIMNPHIQKALQHLQNANYAGYFEEMDKIDLPAHLKTPYAKHKGIFIAGQAPWDFHQLLEVFAKEVDKSLTDNSANQTSSNQSNKTIIQHADKIYNIGNINTANFDPKEDKRN